MRSDYDVWQYNDLIVIVDLELGHKSVTNDIEQVITDLAKRFDLRNKQIAYRDSEGYYDWVTFDQQQRFQSFFFTKKIVVDLYDIIQVYEARRGG